MGRKKKNREFMGSFGTAADVLQKLAQDVYAFGGNDDALRLIITDDGLRRSIAKQLVDALSYLTV